jgi:uncharacterized protein YegL
MPITKIHFLSLRGVTTLPLIGIVIKLTSNYDLSSEMDQKQLSKALQIGGAVGLVVAVIWWFKFFSEVQRIAGSDWGHAFGCLFSSSGACGLVSGIANAAGYWAYQPIIFWVSAVALVAGFVIGNGKFNISNFRANPASNSAFGPSSPVTAASGAGPSSATASTVPPPSTSPPSIVPSQTRPKSIVGNEIFGPETENYSQRVPCAVVMDCSGSMKGQPIASLNRGLKLFEEALKNDEMARRSGRVMLIRVGGTGDGVTISRPFADVDQFSAPVESASGPTPLGAAVLLALDKIEEEKARLRAGGLSYHRPWLFVMSDGAPTDNPKWLAACKRALNDSVGKKVSIFPIAVDGGNVSELQKLTDRSVQSMSSVKFGEFFVWLSNSISGASDETADDPAMAPGLKDWTRS